jgi:prophage antirepressor-like protein
MKLRAIKHEGQMLFLADDVAAVYSKAYGERSASEFVNRVVLGLVNVRKNAYIKKLTYQEIRNVSDSSENDKMSLRRGKQFLSEDLMMLVLQQSTRPAAMEFRQHLIDVLKGRAENMLTFKAKKIESRRSNAPEDILENDTRALARCRAVCRARNANPQAAVGQVTIGLLGTRLSSYAAARGIKHPHRKNLILEMPEVGDLLEASLSLGNHVVANSSKGVEGDVKVGRLYHAAGRMTQLSNRLDSDSILKVVDMLESLTAKA